MTTLDYIIDETMKWIVITGDADGLDRFVRALSSLYDYSLDEQEPKYSSYIQKIREYDRGEISVDDLHNVFNSGTNQINFYRHRIKFDVDFMGTKTGKPDQAYILFFYPGPVDPEPLKSRNFAKIKEKFQAAYDLYMRPSK